MEWVKNKILFVLIAFSVFAMPVYAKAAIEIRYINARQAYIDTFFNKTVAQLIYDESNQHNINPRLILIMIQKESSAVTRSAPTSDTTGTWPLFYNYDERMANCLSGDESACNDTKYGKADYSYRAENYGGVGQQIAYATAQLRNLHDNAGYCGGSLVVSVDGQNITADNAATCALYKYTPHLVSYNTASSFYTNWQSWWTSTPNGGEYVSTNVISSANFNYQAMSVEEINNFLIAKGSWLANYMIAEYISVAYPAIASAPAPVVAPPRKAGDANNDNAVDSTDLSILADQWGKGVTANTGADYNGDGFVDSTDLSILADAWGK